MISLFDKMRANRKRWPAKFCVQKLDPELYSKAAKLTMNSVWEVSGPNGLPEHIKILEVNPVTGFLTFMPLDGKGKSFAGTVIGLEKHILRKVE